MDLPVIIESDILLSKFTKNCRTKRFAIRTNGLFRPSKMVSLRHYGWKNESGHQTGHAGTHYSQERPADGPFDRGRGPGFADFRTLSQPGDQGPVDRWPGRSGRRNSGYLTNPLTFSRPSGTSSRAINTLAGTS